MPDVRTSFKGWIMTRSTSELTGGSAPSARSDDDSRSIARLQVWLRDVWPILAAVAIAEVVAWMLGVRMDFEWLGKSFQLADPALLRTDPLRTSLLMHTQPPLYNLWVGVVLALPGDPALWFTAAAVGFQLVLSLCSFRLAQILGLRRRAAIAVAIIVTCNPQSIVYAYYILYEFPITALLAAMVLAAARAVRSGAPRQYLIMIGCATAVVLIRPQFHPLWLLAVIGTALWFRRPARWRPVAIGIGLSVALIAGLIGKNWVLFHEPTLNSWYGMNLLRVTYQPLTAEQQNALLDNGSVSPEARVEAFGSYGAYARVPGAVAPCQPDHPNEPVLAATVKSTGYQNLNAECYLPLYRQARTDALTALRAEPGAYLITERSAWQAAFVPGSLYPYLNTNRGHVAALDRAYNGAILLTVFLPADGRLLPGVATGDGELEMSMTIVAAVLVCLWRGARAYLRRLRSSVPDGASAALLAVSGLTTAWILSGNLLEIGENYRFRAVFDPVLLVILFSTVIAYVGRRRSVDNNGLDGTMLVESSGG